MTEVSRDSHPPQSEQSDSHAHDSHAARSDYAGLGDRVAGILDAAEAAAAQIRAEAADAATETHNNALAEGSAHLEQIRAEAARLRAEAEASANETRSAAESYGTAQRREAEEQAQRKLAEADTQVRAIRQTAEEMARQTELSARERENTLRSQIHPLELKVRRALDAFREISTQLEELLEAGAERNTESLIDALNVSAETAEPTERMKA